jgi:cytochrome c peroxidase
MMQAWLTRVLMIFGLAVGLMLPLAWAGNSARPGEPIQPIQLPTDLDQRKVELGKMLFFDPRLSRSGWISCNSCHNLSMGGGDNLPSSIGHQWFQGPINAPTVLNASYSLAQFWDGRAANLQEQAGGPIANPGEMALGHTLAVEVLDSIPAYVARFQDIYGMGPDLDTLTDAIAEFERTLVTPNSRFDLWLKGDDDALTEQEQDGYRLFKLTGCVGCHNGPAVGGTAFQKMGSFFRYETDNEATGRFAITGRPGDRQRFKVPSLRNIELTYPYFHDGAVWTLEEAVTTMAKVQLNREFSPEGLAKVVAFLKSLTGEQPSITLPILPPSTAATPRPVPFE